MRSKKENKNRKESKDRKREWGEERGEEQKKSDRICKSDKDSKSLVVFSWAYSHVPFSWPILTHVLVLRYLGHDYCPNAQNITKWCFLGAGNFFLLFSVARAKKFKEPRRIA